MRIAAPVLGPVWLIELRVLIAGLALLPLVMRSPNRAKDAADVRKRMLPLFIVGCFNSAVPFLLLAFASLSLPAGFTSILNATTPLFGTVVAALWFAEELTTSRLLGLVVGFAGVVVLIGWQTLVLTPMVVAGMAAGIGAAMMYAIAAPYARQQLAGLSPALTATASLLSAAAVLLPLLPFTVPAAVPSANVMLSVVMLALFSTSLAYILYFRLLQSIGSSRTITVTYIIPVFAMVWGAMILEEPITVAMMVGGGLVLCGTAIANGLLARFAE
jgi:drug/metabolite transporter (DMT)-like permease